MNDEISNSTKSVIDKDDLNVIIGRAIFSFISSSLSAFAIAAYFILFFQVKYKYLKKNKNEEKESIYYDDLRESSILEPSNSKNNREKIGLGSNYMFYLNLANFFNYLFEVFFYFFYSNKLKKYDTNYIEKYQFQILSDINNDPLAILFGFCHSFFDLSAVCWTTMLTLLFYNSTDKTNKMVKNDKKYLIYGILYGIVFCLFITIPPIFVNGYGLIKYYCSNKSADFDKNGEKIEISKINTFCSYFGITFALLNSIFDIILLCITSKFYSKSLKEIKNTNIFEYKAMKKFIWIFRLFPIVILISRYFKVISRGIIESSMTNSTLRFIIQLLIGLFYASSGIFDAIASMFFFNKHFICCRRIKSDSLNVPSNNKDNFIMEVLKDDELILE